MKSLTFPWDERIPVHLFKDGWSIERLTTKDDRRAEDLLLFMGGSCLDLDHWGEWQTKDKTHLLLSVRNRFGLPRATLLLGDAGWVMRGRRRFAEKTKNAEAFPYALEAIFDQTPRRINIPGMGMRSLIMLQCCPSMMPNSDTHRRRLVTHRAKAWWEAQPYG